MGSATAKATYPESKGSRHRKVFQMGVEVSEDWSSSLSGVACGSSCLPKRTLKHR